MKHFLLSMLFFTAFGLSFAQESTFTGRVLEKDTEIVVPFANVLVVNQQDSVLAAALTTDNGEFKLKLIPQDNLRLRLSGIGYKNTDYPLNINNKELGDLLIEKDVKMLENVDVSAQNTVVQKFDRKVYSMNENKKAASKDIYDLLRTLPGVSVDEQKNVRFKGAEASILVDDMPADYLYPDLEMIPVQMVDKIELIDASMQTGEIGKGGIINIRMQVQKEDGLSGVASLRGSMEKDKLNSGNAYLNLNLKAGKWVFFNNAYIMQGSWASESESVGSLEFNDMNYIENSKSFYDYKYSYLMDYLGAQYNFTDKTKLVLALGVNGNKSENSGGGYMEQLLGGQTYREYNRESNNISETLRGTAYAFFRHSFDTTLREIKIYANVRLPEFSQYSTSTNTYNYQVQNFAPTDSILSTATIEHNKRFSLYSGAYYNHPISEKTRWNANYRASLSNSLQDDNEYYQNGILYLPETTKESGIRFNHFLSTRFGSKLGNWKLDGGINQQHYHYDFTINNYTENLSDTSAYIKADYYNILPSATIMFTIDSLQDLKLSYSRTARAPWYSQLNPILFKRNPYSWSQGNPDLKPIIHNNAYLGYSLNKPMWNLSADLFYSQTNNDVAYLQIPISESIHLSTPENYAYNSRLGIDLGGYLSIKGKYNFNLSGSFYHSEIDSGNLSDALEDLGITPENVKQKNFGYHIKLSTDVSFSQNTSAMFYVNYTSREYSLSGYNFDQISSSINVTQRFFDRRLTLSIGINNLLNDLMPRGSYYDYMNQNYTENILYSTQTERMLFVSLRYRFNKGDRETGQVGQNVN